MAGSAGTSRVRAGEGRSLEVAVELPAYINGRALKRVGGRDVLEAGPWSLAEIAALAGGLPPDANHTRQSREARQRWFAEEHQGISDRALAECWVALIIDSLSEPGAGAVSLGGLCRVLAVVAGRLTSIQLPDGVLIMPSASTVAPSRPSPTPTPGAARVKRALQRGRLQVQTGPPPAAKSAASKVAQHPLYDEIAALKPSEWAVIDPQREGVTRRQLGAMVGSIKRRLGIPVVSYPTVGGVCVINDPARAGEKPAPGTPGRKAGKGEGARGGK